MRIIAPIIIPPNGIGGTLMYANQGCLCPTQGAAAAQDDFLLTAASAT